MKIAVIGSGVSGIGATWALNEYSDHEVHLFEQGEYFGGHTHTVPFKRGGNLTNVDTGFIVPTESPNNPPQTFLPTSLIRFCLFLGFLTVGGNRSLIQLHTPTSFTSSTTSKSLSYKPKCHSPSPATAVISNGLAWDFVPYLLSGRIYGIGKFIE